MIFIAYWAWVQDAVVPVFFTPMGETYPYRYLTMPLSTVGVLLCAARVLCAFKGSVEQRKAVSMHPSPSLKPSTCRYCGSETPPDAVFCRVCGRRIV